MPVTLTIEQAAELTGIGKDTIRNLTKYEDTDFPYFKIGAKILISREELEKWIRKISLEHRQI